MVKRLRLKGIQLEFSSARLVDLQRSNPQGCFWKRAISLTLLWRGWEWSSCIARKLG